MRIPQRRLRHRTRQRQRRRLILIATSGFMVLAAIGLTMFIQTSRVENSLAGEQVPALRTAVVPEDSFVVEKELSAPVFRAVPVGDAQTQLVRVAKPIQAPAAPQEK